MCLGIEELHGRQQVPHKDIGNPSPARPMGSSPIPPVSDIFMHLRILEQHGLLPERRSETGAKLLYQRMVRFRLRCN